MPFTAFAELASRLDDTAGAFTVQTDRLAKHQWDGVVQRFDDANLMQTWSYGAARWGEDNLRHVLLRKDGEIVAAAQAVIKKVPFASAGLCHIKRGPLWQLRARPRNIEIFRQMLQVLRDIYVVRSGLLLRILPAWSEIGSDVIRLIFADEGFKRDLSIGVPRTALIDLSHSLEELRGSLKPTWRRNLLRAEKNRLTIQHEASDSLFEVFAKLYVEMLDRKRIHGVVDIAHFQQMQRTLAGALKMRVMIAEYQGEPIAGIAVPYLGNTAQNVLAATGDTGLDLRGSYLLQWRMLEWLKAQSCRWYDLDAVNHDVYPGISQFKMGLAGRLGWEVEYPGQFESSMSSFSESAVKVGERLLKAYSGIELVISRCKNWRSRPRRGLRSHRDISSLRKIFPSGG
jgi:lipid II:glycine glycyltransferase (peptidoglycan interpeptide bridge formation enzyme)